MARKSHASGLGTHHFNAAQAHTRCVQVVAVFCAVGQSAGGKQAGNHLFKGRQKILAGHAQDAAVLARKRLHAVFGNGAGAQGHHHVRILAKGCVPFGVQGLHNLFGNGSFQYKLLNLLRYFSNKGGFVGVDRLEQFEKIFEQTRRAQQKIAARAYGNGKAARHWHGQHVAQFAQVGGFAAHAVGHA